MGNMKPITIQTGAFQTNTYIVPVGKDAVVIDPGDDFDRIIKALNERGLLSKYVFITHGHFDHIGAVAALRKLGAVVYISESDYELLEKNGFNLGLGFGEPTVDSFIADVKVKDGDEIVIGDHRISVLSTPGHSPGGVCYIFDNSVIFTGDTLFRLSVGRTDLAYGDPASLSDSVDRLFGLDGDFDIYPGHGEASTLDYERKYNFYAKNRYPR